MPPKIDVPPITTAATDGSRYGEPSWRSAALQHAPVARVAQAEEDQGGDRGPQQQRLRDRLADQVAGRELAHEAGHERDAGDERLRGDGQVAADDAGHAERHDQGVDAEDADADAVDE